MESKKSLIFVSVILIALLVIPLTVGCAPKAATGGVLKFIRGTFPSNLGYRPEFWPVDTIYALPVIERLAEWGDTKGTPTPVLAESWEGDPQNKTITWHLRKGVKFHDGTDFNAEACRWNFQLQIDHGGLPQSGLVKSMEVVDEYTLKMYLSDYNRMLIQGEDYSWAMMISPTAFEQAGGGDFEKSKEWARTHSVGTGPFKVSEFQRDTIIKYVKNENYWRKGMPYLDGMEVRYIPDPVTSQAIMEAGEADAWADVGYVKGILELEKKGFKINWGPGMFWSLLPNSSDPNSPFAKKEVREAIEYALDRPAIAKAIGFGTYEPLHQIASSTWPGYVPGYDPRPYNPDKAKELLAAAGYPNGLDIKILCLNDPTSMDSVTMMKSYLDAVGIRVTPDPADMGRYFGSVFALGWSDLVFAASGINPSTTDLFIHFGPNPMTFVTGNIKKSPEYLALCDRALHTYDDDEYIELVKQIVKQAGEDAMIIPIFRSSQAMVMAPYVHSDYIIIHGVIWTAYDDWMEAH